MGILKYIPPKKEIRDFRSDKGGYYEAKCEFCGELFYPKRSDAVYCSDSCVKQSERHSKFAVVDGKKSKPILPIRTNRKGGTVEPKKSVVKPIPKVVEKKEEIVADKKKQHKSIETIESLEKYLKNFNVSIDGIREKIIALEKGKSMVCHISEGMYERVVIVRQFDGTLTTEYIFR